MAAPTRGSAAAGATDAGGAWTFTGASTAAGRVHIAHILQDGNTNGAVSSVVGTNIENLVGTDAVWTQIPGANADGSHVVGSPAAARQFLYIGRALSSSAPTISGANSTSEDLYALLYQWLDVNTGTTLSAVIENGSAGTALSAAGTGTAVADQDVTTLGADRLALNFYGVNLNSVPTDPSGESGGTWVLDNFFSSATGTDGSVSLYDAAMPSVGTIDGGTSTITSASWGVVGFALIGTTSATPASLLYPPRSPTIRQI